MVATADIELTATAPTPTPTPKPSPSPTPCEDATEDATAIEADTDELILYHGNCDTVIITVTGDGGCPVEGDTVKAKVDADGSKYIKVSPKKRRTNSNGEAEFEICSKGKLGDAIVTFKDGSLSTKVYVTVK